jgi:hypothetical protein
VDGRNDLPSSIFSDVSDQGHSAYSSNVALRKRCPAKRNPNSDSPLNSEPSGKHDEVSLVSEVEREVVATATQYMKEKRRKLKQPQRPPRYTFVSVSGCSEKGRRAD